jgi:phage tail sheath gpL-like
VLKALMFAAGVPSDITATTSVVDRRATQTLTLATVVAGNSCTLNGKVYTAVAFTQSPSNGAPAPYQFAVGSTPTLTAVNLAAAINAADPNTVIASSATNVVTLTARTTGTAGNSIATVSGTNITAGGATLAGGTATQAIKSTTNTTGNTVLLLWYKKTRVVGQW